MIADNRPGWFVPASHMLGMLISLAALALAAQLPIRLGLLVYTEQVLAAMLGMALGICFLTRPLTRRSIIGHKLDALCATAGIIAGLYLTIRYPVLAEDFFHHQSESVVVGVILIPLILEALRRATGITLTIVTLVFMVYALVADKVPGRLQGMDMSPADLVSFVTIDNLAIFGLPLSISGVVVVMFIIFGQLLQQTGGANWFTDMASAAVGRYRGGPVKIAVVASGLFGSISGSAVANVASTGIITIPMMKKSGLSPARAGAYEAAASTGGQIAPPIMGAAAFLMAEFLGLSYVDVITAAAIPAFLFYFTLLLSADLDAARLGMSGLDPDKIPKAKRLLMSGWYYPVPFIALVVLLFAWNLGPEGAALWAAAVLLVLVTFFGHQQNRLGPRGIMRILAKGGIGSMEVILVGAAAGIIIGILENTGLSFGLTYLLVGLGDGQLWILLMVSALICVLLGMGMPTTGIYVLVATLAGPPLIKLGVEPLAAHLFLLYFGLMSMISPPVAIAAFTAASIAGAKPLHTAMSAMRVSWIAFIMPFLFVADTALLMQGSIEEIAIALVSVMVGIWAVAVGLSGYFISALPMTERVMLAVSGGLLLFSRFGVVNDLPIIIVSVVGIAAVYLQCRRRMAPVQT